MFVWVRLHGKMPKAAAMAIPNRHLLKLLFWRRPELGAHCCAAGYSGAAMNADKVNLSIGGVRLVENGMNCNIPLTRLTDIMSEHDITMTIDMAAGNECATVWTCDFSYEYVKINGEYHT